MLLWTLSWDHILTSLRERYWPYNCVGTEGGNGTNSVMFHHVVRKVAEVPQRGQWERRLLGQTCLLPAVLRSNHTEHTALRTLGKL